MLVIRPTVDTSVRRDSDGQIKVKKLHEMHETPIYRPMGLICQRDEGSEVRIPSTALCDLYNFLVKITQFQASLRFELEL